MSVAASAEEGSGSATPAAGLPTAPSQTPLPLPSTAVDAGLLAVLPETIGGAPVVETPEAEYGSVGDPAIARIAERLATAFVVSPSEADWAVVSVVALRPGTWSEALFRDWRDTYSAGVCEQEGGVGARASAEIGGREVHIVTCGALRTYHVHLPGRDVIVSVAAVGDGRFGERMMAGLRP